MAIYEYRCTDCHKTFTVSEPISRHTKGKQKLACPGCGSRKTRQLLSSFFAKTSSKT